MSELYKCLKSDFYKLKHTLVLKLHVWIPLLVSLVFLMYFRVANRKVETMASVYLEVIAIGFPFIISLITSLIVEQEEIAGGFQYLLVSTKIKSVTFLSKIILLVILAISSVFIALGLFGIGIKGMSLYFYLKIANYLVASNVFIYILHLILSLKFGKGVSIGIGLVGTLISALMLTGLGEGIWIYTPWAWGVRLGDYTIMKEVNPSLSITVNTMINKGIISISIFTLAILIFSVIWFKRWEGRKVYE